MINKVTLVAALLLFLLGMISIGISCNVPVSNTSSKTSDAVQSPGAQSPASPPPAAQSEQTADQLCQTGKTVYATACVKCHGSFEQPGPRHPLIGPGVNLSKYATARGLLEFMRTTMPPSAPDSLPSQSYLQVLACLLLENKYVLPGAILSPDQLDNIGLAR